MQSKVQRLGTYVATKFIKTYGWVTAIGSHRNHFQIESVPYTISTTFFVHCNTLVQFIYIFRK